MKNKETHHGGLMKFSKYFILCLLLFGFLTAQDLHSKITSSGGELLPEQAAYDVKFYELNLRIEPGTKSISGYTTVEVIVVENLSVFVLHLSNNFTVDSVVWIENNLPASNLGYTHQDGLLRINLSTSQVPGKRIKVQVHYRGKPKEALNPPWDPGFVWKKTQNQQDWIGVACEDEGGDIWWPCKDHPSDEPDSVALHFTVPQHLTCVANGQLRKTTNNNDGTKTFYWFVSNPINNYNVSLYIAPYQTVTHQYESVTGETFPVTIWVLPESYSAALNHTPQFLDHLRFIEETCGPYPFWIDKYGVAEAPYLGMEHQTIIAYGYQYRNNSYGFDYLHLHELAHEWWGNLVTAKDWSDVWIHEGFATYIEALYVEKKDGIDRYHSYMNGKSNWNNNSPIAPRAVLTAEAGFGSGDVYNKASWVLHTLRYYLGDEKFFPLFRRWAYPDPALELIRDGSQCRLATTDDFLQLAETVTGIELDWFFEAYLRQASIPTLKTVIQNDTLILTWSVENDIPFSIPVEVKFAGSIVKVEMPFGEGKIKIPGGLTPEIDPNKWIMADIRTIDPILNPTFDLGILLVNGVEFSTYGSEITNAYQNRAFWGDYPISFWDCFEAPSGGYPSTLPVVLGHGRVPSDILGQFSTIIWVGNNYHGDLIPWQETSIFQYLEAGGNVLLMSRYGRSFFNPELKEYLGVYWAESSTNTITNCVATYAGLKNMTLTGTQSINAVFDMNLGNLESKLLFKETASFTSHRGLGVWRKPVTGGTFRIEGGQFVFLSGRPYRYESSSLRSNVEFILDNFFLESSTSVNSNSGNELVYSYELSQNYPNPFNSSTSIEFEVINSTEVTLKIYNLIGEEVATILDNKIQAGKHKVTWNAYNFESGVYLYRLRIEQYEETKKLLLIK